MEKQYKSYSTINETSLHPLILTCEHASAKIPEGYNNLGLDEKLLDTHIARDKGCKELTIELAKRLGCSAYMANYSRLFIDFNRRQNEESLIVDNSDQIPIPGNQNLSVKEKQYRIQNYYKPYYDTIFAKINKLQSNNIKPQILSIHGFTPKLQKGEYRPWNAGVLFVKENPLSFKLLNGLKDIETLKIDANVPYDMRVYNTGSSTICGHEIGLDNATIEIKDTEFDDVLKGTQKWADILENILLK